VTAQNQRFLMPCGPSADRGHQATASLGSALSQLRMLEPRSGRGPVDGGLGAGSHCIMFVQ
jgi:hypothetical protein